MTIELLNMDCMDYLRDCEDNAFDLAIVDPPYGIGNWIQTTGNVSPNFENVDWNDSSPDGLYFDEVRRVSKEWIIWGANYYNCFDQKGGSLIWHKQIPEGSNFSECEIASISMKKSVDYCSIAWPSGFYRQIAKNEGNQIHPCQKPVKLYKWILEKYAKEGDRILDTHLGSGSSAIAAHYGQFDFVGIEIDEDYYKAACERFEKETAQLDLLA